MTDSTLQRPAAFTRLRLAFQFGKTTFFDRVISAAAGVPVHVELVFNDNLSYSASNMKSGATGTRFTDQLDFSDTSPFAWHFVELDPALAAKAFDFCVAEEGCPYDYYGIAVGWTYNCRPSPTRWFCSEVVAAAVMHANPLLLKSQSPQYYTPRRLWLESTTPKPADLVQ